MFGYQYRSYLQHPFPKETNQGLELPHHCQFYYNPLTFPTKHEYSDPVTSACKLVRKYQRKREMPTVTSSSSSLLTCLDLGLLSIDSTLLVVTTNLSPAPLCVCVRVHTDMRATQCMASLQEMMIYNRSFIVYMFTHHNRDVFYNSVGYFQCMSLGNIAENFGFEHRLQRAAAGI